MKNWQFLIQKQGDHTWRTLESPNLKVVAGDYRVLARSDLNNTEVEVLVTHISTQEVPPKQRILKRLRRTNAEGLMAVIPFTHLKPGIWQLQCSGDVMSDMLGKSWQHTLVIQVSEETTSVPINTKIDSKVNIVVNQETPLWLGGKTTEEILGNLLDLALPKDEPLADQETIENAPTLPPSLPLNLSLDKDTYVTRWGENLNIHGYVEANEIENLGHEGFSLDGMSHLGLEIALRSPLESKVFKKIHQPLTKEILPFPFSSFINIPECESKLLLADMNLYGRLADIGQVMLLATHTFTITADITELLALQTSSLNGDNFGQETKSPKPLKHEVNLGLELFNLAKTPKLARFHILKPSSHPPLPPQIKPHPRWERVSPQLPILPNHSPEKINGQAATDITVAIPPIDLQKLVIKSLHQNFPYLKRLKAKTVPGEIANHNLEYQKIPLPQSPELPTIVTSSATIPELPIDHTQKSHDSVVTEISYAELIAGIVVDITNTEPFSVTATEEILPSITAKVLDTVETHEGVPTVTNPGLDLDPVETEEVLSIIKQVSETVAGDTNSPLVKKWMETQEYLVSSGVSQPSSNQESQEQSAPGDDPDMEQHFAVEVILSEVNRPEIVNSPHPIEPLWLSQEIVMDDLVVAVDTDETSDQPVENLPPSQNETLGAGSGVMIDSLPIPQLYLPDGELVAGTSVVVRLELPQVLSSVAVKLWAEDCQTRSLLDGPHILSNFRSNAWGNRETAISLKIPFGCLEVRLAAIALDQTTLRESDRVAVIKTVIPPDLPTIELDEMLGI
ncbi:MAG: hypothetical protein ACKO11_07115 [Cuspidothrix sp.]